MPPRHPLPEPFSRAPFTVGDAVAAGITRDRLRSRDLQRPFHAVRSSGLDLTSLHDSCHAYTAWMRAGNAFGFRTAALLWGMPLPAGDSGAVLPLHVVAPAPARAPQGRHVAGHRLRLARSDVTTLHGLPVVTPAVAWCQVSASCSVPDAVAAAEWLVTGNPYQQVLPLASVSDLEAASLACGATRGRAIRREALPLVRVGALSRPETLVRLLLERAGIPAARINEYCYSATGEFLAMPDLSWPEYKVALEYEGDHHRAQGQYRRDIRRVEILIDNGWLVVRVSADDLFGRPDEVVSRVAARLVARGWSGRIDLRHLGRSRR